VTEEVRVNLVQVPLLARARGGQPVTDLRPEEIVVKQGGRRLPVLFLEPFAAPMASTDIPGVRLVVNLPGGTEVSVRAGEPRPRHVIVLVDVQNDYALNRPQAADEVVSLLTGRSRLGTRYAVFSYTGELNLETPFSPDPEAVAAALRRAYGRPTRPQLALEARTRNLLDQLATCGASGRVDESCARGVVTEHADEVRPAAAGYLGALDQVVRAAAGLRERATVLALTHGVALDPAPEVMEAVRALFGNTEQAARLQLELDPGEGMDREMERLMALAVREQVTLHFVDRNPPPTEDRGARRGVPLAAGFAPAQAAFRAAQNDLEEMAAWTGGVFRHSTDIGEGLQEVLALEEAGYLLGYTTDERLSPQRLRKVKIRTTRRGVRLIHRRGSYAGRDPAPSLPGGLLLAKPLALEDGSQAEQFVPFTVQMDPAGLGYQRVGGEMKASFSLQIELLDAAERFVAGTFHQATHAYPWVLWERQEIEPVLISGYAELPAGSYRLVARAYAPASGRRGEWIRELVIGTTGD
jgi:VWFA-related protein